MNKPQTPELPTTATNLTNAETPQDRYRGLKFATVGAVALGFGALGFEQQQAGDAAGAVAGWVVSALVVGVGVAYAKKDAFLAFCRDIANQ